MSENGNHGNNDGEVIIDVKNLHKNYGHTEVIKGVDLTVRERGDLYHRTVWCRQIHHVALPERT